METSVVAVSASGDMMQKRDKLSIRIPWLLEAVAEGRVAIAATFVLVLVLVATIAKGMGWFSLLH